MEVTNINDLDDKKSRMTAPLSMTNLYQTVTLGLRIIFLFD